jgi:hypothetical protein
MFKRGEVTEEELAALGRGGESAAPVVEARERWRVEGGRTDRDMW